MSDERLLHDAVQAFWDREDWRQGYYSDADDLVAQAVRMARLVQWAKGERDDEPCPVCESNLTDVTGGTFGVRCPFHKAVEA